MELSLEAAKILSLCWVNDEPRGTSFVIGETYQLENENYTTTENTYSELINYQEFSTKPYKVARFGKVVNAMGGKLK